MIIRYEGGNSGITAYLEEGRKEGRENHRDEIDHRVILDGNLELTNQVIESIPNEGQDRYLRLVMSFYEDDIDTETMVNIVSDYKEMLMSAYTEEEYSFYAEAHIPKIKHDVDYGTGELIERKPHIHIVIPKVNLVNGNSLNPVGLTELNIDYLDAIQEKINRKYGLVSPKDRPREADFGKNDRIKGDFFNERNQAIKEKLLNRIQDENIRDIDSFKKIIAEEGELRIYNEGKNNEYYGIKQEGETKFTRLKNNFFSKEFIEDRAYFKSNLDSHIEKKVDDWINKRSLEVKYINPATPNVRKEYSSLKNDESKIEFLQKAKDEFYNDKETSRLIQNRSNTQRGFKKHQRRTIPEQEFEKRLPSMPFRKLDYGLRGHQWNDRSGNRELKANKSNELLFNVQNSNMAEAGQQREHSSRSVRWLQNTRTRRPLNSVVSEKIREFEQGNYKADKELLEYLKKNVAPERFISQCIEDFSIDPEKHKITQAKDGSPRFSVKNRNLNALDFLTKHINLDVDKAVNYLIKINDDEIKNIDYINKSNYKGGFDKREIGNYIESFKDKKNQAYDIYKSKLKEIDKDFYERIKGISEKDNKKYNLMKSFFLVQKLQKKEEVKEIYSNSITAIKSHFVNFNSVEGYNMKRLKEAINPENNIEAYEEKKLTTYDELLQRNKHFARFESSFVEGRKLKDYVVHKDDKKNQLNFMNQDNKKVVFSDKGEKVVFTDKKIDMADIKALMEYSHEKYGGKLKLSGNAEFKTACAIACSELGLNVILKPDKYHEMMVNHAKLQTQEKTVEPETPIIENDKNNISRDEKVYLEIPDNEIENAKKIKGVEWDSVENKWFIDEKSYHDLHAINIESIALSAYGMNDPDYEKIEHFKNLHDSRSLKLGQETDREITVEDVPEVKAPTSEQKGNISHDLDNSLTYIKLKEFDSMKLDYQDNLLKMAKGLDDKTKILYEDKIIQTSKIFETTQQIKASENVKEQIFNTSLTKGKHLAHASKEITDIAHDMGLKGRVNFSDGKFSMNSFKDKNKEKVSLLMSFDSNKNQGEIKVDDKTYNFTNLDELKNNMKDIRNNIEKAIQRNEANQEMDR